MEYTNLYYSILRRNAIVLGRSGTVLGFSIK
jgi:hypothetical protein